MLLTEQSYQKIDLELSKYPKDKRQSSLIAALAIAQEENSWLSPEIIEEVAKYIGIPPIVAQEVATFYNMFNTEHKCKNRISVCTNLPCALRGGAMIANYLKNKLGIDFHETTSDLNFTLLEGECAGACGDAPVILINNKHICIKMTEEKVDLLIDALKKESGE
ncbi:NADH dehydrogenase I subunit E [Candidatus Kinetoplastibacterium blastocrithidii TCC012E]|uniref:NADH dehydrogenase I subunit E n=1 Tax=Candidatus Kinetoplastidibacterium blastocrithidiae TCC012E TaxID=1208922 RepID=M1LBV0_9PROT|nr:NADH-quinone oxidoreductase subunit NuoE [Candidatus Kinetoplastibacterium blastocrithidii]AFZ83803.1 NADH dehydrogenase subunit E [Candidatus Kinetoplastibacterium blastocrithidii (ex Strigomonas culicis)]AGF49928.1 NADH dehydrogenase I subunit E [Candidatus Kinetoplastibacterium blastocrithidii TCC012E]